MTHVDSLTIDVESGYVELACWGPSIDGRTWPNLWREDIPIDPNPYKSEYFDTSTTYATHPIRFSEMIAKWRKWLQ